ncbi:hypothetical protein BVU_4158 [Phocaeicola vulgatus ATCC 8482]|uniref:Uncharacterized protein n=1 Tax=Phocaeicola vulgatus (strain ATCC 8482 / DSM 1447 / JCM 5826 / CCUG 4940 / NBRC 14291 / NCTC 11154) TaxID=435590 RepID=A6L7U5_PHOV8|nr:hypothetical protein BVU_4158 [Phocaeicola vulgatus ATCC 8482]
MFLNYLFQLPRLRVIVFCSTTYCKSFFHFYFDNLHFRSLIHFHIVCFHNFRTINLDYNFSMILFRHYTPQLYHRIFFYERCYNCRLWAEDSWRSGDIYCVSATST